MCPRKQKNTEVDFFQEYRKKDILKVFYLQRIILINNRQMAIVDNNVTVLVKDGWLKVSCIEDDAEDYSFTIHPRKLLLDDPRLKMELDEIAIKIDPTQIELNKKHNILEGQEAFDLFN